MQFWQNKLYSALRSQGCQSARLASGRIPKTSILEAGSPTVDDGHRKWDHRRFVILWFYASQAPVNICNGMLYSIRGQLPVIRWAVEPFPFIHDNQTIMDSQRAWSRDLSPSKSHNTTLYNHISLGWSMGMCAWYSHSRSGQINKAIVP